MDYTQSRLDESALRVGDVLSVYAVNGRLSDVTRYPCNVFVMPAQFERDGLTVFRKMHHTEFYGDVTTFHELLHGCRRADRAIFIDAPRRFDHTPKIVENQCKHVESLE